MKIFSRQRIQNHDPRLRSRLLRWLINFKKKGKKELHSRLKTKTAELEEANRKLVLYSQKLQQSLLKHCHIEEALKRSEEHTRLIIDTAQDAFVSLDSNGTIIDWSKQATHTFGWTRREIIGSNFFTTIVASNTEQIHECDLKRFAAANINPALKYRIELTMLNKENHTFPVEMTISPIRLGTSTIFNLFVHDITERKNTEIALAKSHNELEHRVAERTHELTYANEELKRVSQIKSDFMSMMTHELRIPLTAIKESVNLIFDGVSGPVNEEQSDVLTITLRNVERLSRQINNVLGFNNLHSGQFHLKIEDVNITSLVTDVYKFMTPHTTAKKLEFMIKLPPHPLWMACDADKIRQVLINIVGNAVKFTEPGGRITLRINATDSHVVLEVEDTGVGIKREDHSLIFEAFRQVLVQGMWKTGGTGVGLAICKEIVSRHDGEISVDSQIGRGSRFVVKIPQRVHQKRHTPNQSDRAVFLAS